MTDLTSGRATSVPQTAPVVDREASDTPGRTTPDQAGPGTSPSTVAGAGEPGTGAAGTGSQGTEGAGAGGTATGDAGTGGAAPGEPVSVEPPPVTSEPEGLGLTPAGHQVRDADSNPGPSQPEGRNALEQADSDEIARSPGDPDPSTGVTEPGPDFRTALVIGVTMDLPNQYPTVMLRETESPRRQLSFSLALQDGVVLSHVIRRIPTPRPLTHELLSEVLSGFEIDVVAVRLVGRRGAVYFAELDLRGRNGRSVHSCRPSDGLAVALMQAVPVPILIDARLFDESGDVDPGSRTASH